MIPIILTVAGVVLGLYAGYSSFKRLKNPVATRGQIGRNMTRNEKILELLAVLLILLAYLVSRYF